MALPTFSMRQLLEAGVHFGHQTRRWNPKMAPFIFGVRNGIHVIDLQQTVPMLYQAMEAVRDVATNNGRVLFVGTKRQAQEPIADAAKRCGQYFVNHRWLGGMLTNWKTISHSIRRLRELDEELGAESSGFTKKELLNLTRERDKLERALGGIKEMGGLPDMLFVIDTNKESIAVLEARRLGVPVVAVVDSNSDPTGIRYPIPGNDDALRAIQTYCDLIAGAVIEGLQAELQASGVDVGARDAVVPEAVPELAAAQAAPESGGTTADQAGAAEELARAGAATSEGAEASEGEAKPAKRPPRKAGAGARRRKEKPAGDA
jgi:small subunit ribosomal protein S2